MLYSVIPNALYFLALINPASKIFILSSMDPPFSKRELLSISIRSSVVALGILVLCAYVGNFIFHDIFKVEVYSLQIAGGFVLFSMALGAIKRGAFTEEPAKRYHSDISIVPIAAPLIAGPGTVTGTISFASANGQALAVICLALAVGANFLLMLLSARIGRLLARFSATGPLIRLTGLIVAAVSVQMILTGCDVWLTSVLRRAGTL